MKFRRKPAFVGGVKSCGFLGLEDAEYIDYELVSLAVESKVMRELGSPNAITEGSPDALVMNEAEMIYLELIAFDVVSRMWKSVAESMQHRVQFIEEKPWVCVLAKWLELRGKRRLQHECEDL